MSDIRSIQKLPNGIKLHGWTITTNKGSIGALGDLKYWSEKIGLPTLPDMTFGNTNLRLVHENGFTYEFNALDALAGVDKTTGPNLKVQAAAKWSEGSKQQLSSLVAEQKIVLQPLKEFDWTYTTKYKGTTSPGTVIEQTTEKINIAMLQKPDPILFFDEIILYEDELADNGTASLSVKLRVMPSCLLVLLRFFLRVDGVFFRVNDTRLFLEFAKDAFIREFQSKEGDYKRVAQLLAMPSEEDENVPRGSVTDPNAVGQLLDQTEIVLEKVKWK